MITPETVRLKVAIATTTEELDRWRPFWRQVSVQPDCDIDFYSLFVSQRSEVLNPYVLAVLEKFAGGGVESDADLFAGLVAGQGNGFEDDFDSFIV